QAVLGAANPGQAVEAAVEAAVEERRRAAIDAAEDVRAGGAEPGRLAVERPAAGDGPAARFVEQRPADPEVVDLRERPAGSLENRHPQVRRFRRRDRRELRP